MNFSPYYIKDLDTVNKIFSPLKARTFVEKTEELVLSDFEKQFKQLIELFVKFNWLSSLLRDY